MGDGQCLGKIDLGGGKQAGGGTAVDFFCKGTRPVTRVCQFAHPALTYYQLSQANGGEPVVYTAIIINNDWMGRKGKASCMIITQPLGMVQ